MSIILLNDIESLREWRSQHQQIAFVPTMGSLHEGHLSLIRAAKQYASQVLISIFINPTQFNDTEDFERYPRTLSHDLTLATQAGADACFAPTVHDIYPPNHQTSVHIGSLAEGLCGRHRPGHFTGVCTVVSALLLITQCDYALFGEKDYQQLAIIRQMVKDLHFPVKIIGLPTARAIDGLALSSRNIRLNKEDRQKAPLIYQSLCEIQEHFQKGGRDTQKLLSVARRQLDPIGKIDYLTIVDPDTLMARDSILPNRSSLCAVAITIGGVRLIDNLMLTPSN